MIRTFMLITILATLAGCGGGLAQDGGPERLANLLKYTTPPKMHARFYDDRWYEGDNPARQIENDLRPAGE